MKEERVVRRVRIGVRLGGLTERLFMREVRVGEG